MTHVIINNLLFCLKLLHTKPCPNCSGDLASKQDDSQKERESFLNKLWKNRLMPALKCLDSIALLEKEYEKMKGSHDLEMGKSGNSCPIRWSGKDDDVAKKGTASFLGHMDELVGVEGEVVLNLGALVYCMEDVVKESREIEKGIREAVQWENPSTQVDSHNILCKLHAVKCQ